MARPKLGDSESKRLQMVISEDELRAVEDWQFANRIPSKSEAIRRLVQIGLTLDRGVLDAAEQSARAFHTSFEAVFNVSRAIEQHGISGDDFLVQLLPVLQEQIDAQKKLSDTILGMRTEVNALRSPGKMEDAMELRSIALDEMKQASDGMTATLQKILNKKLQEQSE